MKYASLMVFALALFFFSSCEFGSNYENFHEIKPPPEKIWIAINLANINPDEIFYVRNGTLISYNLNTEGYEVIESKFFLNGEEIGVGNQVSLDIENPDYVKIYTLTIKITLKSGSGSLADYAGVEIYNGEFSYQIMFR